MPHNKVEQSRSDRPRSDDEQNSRPLQYWLELDRKKDFPPLIEALTTQCDKDNKDQTTLYLAIEYNLMKLAAHLLTSKEVQIDLTAKDKDGFTLRQYAERYDRAPVTSTLIVIEEQEKRMRQKQERELIRLEALIKRWQHFPLPMSPVYQTEEQAFSERFKKLLDLEFSGLRDQLIHAFWAIKHKKRPSQEHAVINAILNEVNALCDQLMHPAQLIELHHSPGIFSTFFKSHHDTATGRLMTDIATVRSKLPKTRKYETLSQRLFDIHQYYQRTLNAPALTSPAILYTTHYQVAYVKEEYIGYFLPEYDTNSRVRAVDEQSTHSVHEADGMHFKQNPDYPGVQSMTYLLSNLLTTVNAPQTRLVKILYQGVSHLIQISKTIEGVSLDSICRLRPEYLASMHPGNFSELFFLSVLTTPKDGKANQYQYQPQVNQRTREVTGGKCVEVDGDLNFAMPVVKKDKGHIIDLKCIIFLLPGMNNRIDPKTKADFLNLKPATMVLTWLQSLQKENIYYNQLIERGFFTAKEAATHQLPIRLYPGTAQTLFNRITRMQALLREDSENQLNHQDLFKAIHPLVHKVYQTLMAQENDPLAVMERLYEAEMASIDGPVIEDLLKDELDTDLLPGETIRDYLSRQHANIDEYIDGRTEQIDQAIHDFVASLDCSTLSEADELGLIAQLGRSPVSVKKIRLRSCRVTLQELTESLIQPLGSTGKSKKTLLQELVIENPTRAKMEGIAAVCKTHRIRCKSEPSVPVHRALHFINTASALKIEQQDWMKLPSRSAQQVPVLPWYTDRDIQSYLDAVINQEPFGGHGNKLFQVYAANGQATVQASDDYLFLLPAASDLCQTDPDNETSLSAWPLIYSIDKESRPLSELAAVAAEAYQQDSQEVLAHLLEQGRQHNKRYERLHALCQEYPNWDELKLALHDLVQVERPNDVIDEMMACMNTENARAKILFPYNLRLSHWVAGELLVEKRGHTFTITAYAHDPYGAGKLPEDSAKAIQKAFSDKLSRLDNNYQLIFNSEKSPYGRRQAIGDNRSCGPITARDIERRCRGQTLNIDSPYPFGASELREQQARKVGHALGEQDHQQAQCSESRHEPSLPRPMSAHQSDSNSPSEEQAPSWLLCVEAIRSLKENNTKVKYQVTNDGYDMLVDAIKESSRQISYQPFIELLLDASYRVKPNSSTDEQTRRKERIQELVTQRMMNGGDDFSLLLQNIPLHCRQHFRAENYMEQFYTLAGSVLHDSKEPQFNNNLAMLAVLYATPFHGVSETDVPLSYLHTEQLVHYFRANYAELWTEQNNLGLSAEALHQLLYLNELPEQELLSGISNQDLRHFYQQMVKLWRTFHHYLINWHDRNDYLNELNKEQNSMNSVLYVISWLYFYCKKLNKRVAEEDLFRSREKTALRTLAMVDFMIFLPVPNILIWLDVIRQDLRRNVLNGSHLKKILDHFFNDPNSRPTRDLVRSEELMVSMKSQQTRQYVTERDLRIKAEEQSRQDAQARQEAEQRAEREAQRAEQEAQRAEREAQRAEREAQAKLIAEQRAEHEARAKLMAEQRAEQEVQARLMAEQHAVAELANKDKEIARLMALLAQSKISSDHSTGATHKERFFSPPPSLLQDTEGAGVVEESDTMNNRGTML